LTQFDLFKAHDAGPRWAHNCWARRNTLWHRSVRFGPEGIGFMLTRDGHRWTLQVTWHRPHWFYGRDTCGQFHDRSWTQYGRTGARWLCRLVRLIESRFERFEMKPLDHKRQCLTGVAA
jgi:hypothetical protein